ncbi:MAG: PEP/pyruvate-binding domain-containing protein [Candidatus Dojkabacteria bacterium]|nr:MAG: PEP/pyruvate-binding domain-containing protein [Candidatus Dojkabacteria bacterium]
MESIIFYQDIGENSVSFREEHLGRKGLSLALLTKFKLPVPPFFIIPTGVFKDYISRISKNVNIGTIEELRKEVVSTPLPPEYHDSIADSYRKLSGFGKAWVAVRGSISAPKHPNISFSGQLDTFLNIRDVNEIELAIKEIYASLFNESVYEYLRKNNVPYSDVSVSIIVQKMIQSEVSGIMYTFDPITMNRNNVSIEAVFGLGDVLNDGTINPDIYVVSKNSYEVVEKKIVPQEWMKVRRIGDISSLEHVQKIKISKVWQYSQKLDENLIKDLANVGSRVESIIDPFQIVEWTMEGGNIWILQIKAVSTKLLSEDKLPTQDQRISTMEVEQKSARIDESLQEPVPEIKKRKKSAEIQETLLFLGNAASPGTAYGRALVLSAEVLKQDMLLEELLAEATKETILVTEEFSSKLEPFFYKIGGVITNYGGINSDAAITSRELNLPAIVGTRIATVFIQNGTLLKIDGASGTVYRIDALPEIEGDGSHTKKAPSLSKASREASQVTTNEYSLPTKSRLSDAPENDVFKLFVPNYLGNSHYLLVDDQSKADPDLDYSGVLVNVKEITAASSKKFKKLKHNISGALYLVLEDNASVDSVMEKKRKLSAYNLRRSRKIRIILEVGSFFTLLNLERFIGLNIDGFVFNLEKLSATYGNGATTIDDNLLLLLQSNIQKVKQQQLHILACAIPSEFITTPLSKEIISIAKSGCNSIIVNSGKKSVSNDTIVEFSSAYQSAILTKE